MSQNSETESVSVENPEIQKPGEKRKPFGEDENDPAENDKIRNMFPTCRETLLFRDSD